MARLSLGIDHNIGWTLALRLWAILAGLLLIVAMSFFLTVELQGYFYTFSSILALQALFELGLTQVLVQTTSHEFVFLVEATDAGATMGTVHGRKLAFLAHFARRWYAAISLIFLVVVAVGGTIYFLYNGHLAARQWQGPWLLLVVTTALNLYLSPRLAFIEGAGHPGLVAELRFKQSVLGYALMLGLLAAGTQLWAASAVPAMAVLVTTLSLRRSRRVPDFFASAVRTPAADDPSWRREVFGLQWRVAVSWLGGYLASFAFTPVLFSAQGAAVAGQWGMTFAALISIQTLGMSWMSAKTPRLGALIAQRDRATLNATFYHAAILSTLLTALGCAALILVVWVGPKVGLALDRRMLSPVATIYLSGGMILNTVVYSMAVYMRAHKEEPLALSSIVIGGITIILAYISAASGAQTVAISFLAVTALVNLPWRARIFARYLSRVA